jgi:hypothetical protein
LHLYQVSSHIFQCVIRGREYAIVGTSDGYVNNTVNFSRTTLPEGEASFVVTVTIYKLEK